MVLRWYLDADAAADANSEEQGVSDDVIPAGRLRLNVSHQSPVRLSGWPIPVFQAEHRRCQTWVWWSPATTQQKGTQLDYLICGAKSKWWGFWLLQGKQELMIEILRWSEIRLVKSRHPLNVVHKCDRVTGGAPLRQNTETSNYL